MTDAQRFDIPDSWGLENKVAIVTGGGAAGDGIGNGRAAAILLGRAGAPEQDGRGAPARGLSWSTATWRWPSARSK